MVSARIFYCARCHTQVVICSCCDRGQIYCNKKCSQAACAISCRASGQRYQNSRHGKLNHAARQRRYRDHERAKKNKVTHHTYHEPKDCVLLPEEPDNMEMDKLHCHFCKRPVDSFVRRRF